MDRRTAIRNIVIASAGTLLIPSCSKIKTINFLSEGKLLLDSEHKVYLAKISESFLPIQGISEKIGKPEDFILTMLNDCSAPKDIQQFAKGFEQYKALMKESKLKMESSDLEKALPIVENILKSEPLKEELIFFINTTKNISIHHLTSSEYYMTEYLGYKLVPGAYEGCVDISTS
jgi:hypothetical protein